jgi:hypothetical protein
MTVQKYAIVEGVDVINIILMADGDLYTPPEGCLVLEAPEDISIGWRMIANDWVAPEEPPAPEQPTEDPDVTAAKYEGLKELTDLGISETTARRIVGLPVEE